MKVSDQRRSFRTDSIVFAQASSIKSINSIALAKSSMVCARVQTSCDLSFHPGILYNLVEILSDDTRQGEINITSNDGEISTWLEQTFSSRQQRAIASTGRFESIKAIIQASSFVNALQRQLRQHTRERLAVTLNLPVDIDELNHWSFNMMEHSEPMLFSLLLIFDAHDLISRYRIDIDVLKNFGRALTEGYTSA